MWAWPGWGQAWQPAQVRWGWELEGWRSREAGTQSTAAEGSETDTETQGEERCAKTWGSDRGDGWGGRGGGALATQEQGHRLRAQSPCHHLVSLLPNLNPHPKQDAVSMTTWPGQKRGRGTAEEIFHISSKGGGHGARKELAHTMGAVQGPWSPKSPCPQPQAPSPRLRPANWHPRLWAAGKGDGLGEAQGSNVQRSAAAQASCVCAGGGEWAAGS